MTASEKSKDPGGLARFMPIVQWASKYDRGWLRVTFKNIDRNQLLEKKCTQIKLTLTSVWIQVYLLREHDLNIKKAQKWAKK